MREVFAGWLESRLGVPLGLAACDAIPVVACDRPSQPLWAVQAGARRLVTVRADWLDAIGAAVRALTPDELFSTFGAAELARVTLPDGWGVWGPTWYYVADESAFLGEADPRVERLTPEQVAQIDLGVFWHCRLGPEATYFGLYDEGRLAALAGLHMDEGEVWEISVDVAPEAKGGGLGRAVCGTAGRFVLEHGRLAMAATAPWNVPSARLMRSLGMAHVLSDMRTMPAPFRVPPPMLGSPLPGVELRHYYPAWAMNQAIRPRED